MLTETEKALITAAVDGELSAADATAFERLVADRGEAARLYRRLSDTADRLRRLPRLAAPPRVATRVMARVRPVSPARKVAARRPSLLVYLVAASVLLAVSVGSFFFFRDTPNVDLAQQKTLPAPDRGSVLPDEPPPEPVAMAKGGSAEDGTGVVKPADLGGAVAKLPPAEVPQLPPQLPPMTPEEKELFGSGLMVEAKPLTQIDPALPLILPAVELDQKSAVRRLKERLATGHPARLDLFSRNPKVVIEHLQAVAAEAGVSVFVEGRTAEWMRNPMGLSFAFYVENLTADELAGLLAALARRVNATPNPETVLGTAHFFAADLPEQLEVKNLLGITWTLPKPAKRPADPRSITDRTLDEVVASVKKPGEKVAIALTPLANSARATEVKQFLEKRGGRKPGTTPLLIVVRPPLP